MGMQGMGWKTVSPRYAAYESPAVRQANEEWRKAHPPGWMPPEEQQASVYALRQLYTKLRDERLRALDPTIELHRCLAAAWRMRWLPWGRPHWKTGQRSSEER